MPTSNGQVTTRDIRRDSIVTTLLHDDAVSTAKLVDLAVTVGKTDEPVFVTAVESNPFSDESLTTTLTEVATITIDVPSWVAQVSVFAIANAQMTNSSGGAQAINASAQVNDSLSGARTQSVVDGTVGSVDHVSAVDLIVPGTSVDVSVYASVSTGTNSVNNGAVWAIVVGTR